jgi:hypothetical protein
MRTDYDATERCRVDASSVSPLCAFDSRDSRLERLRRSSARCFALVRAHARASLPFDARAGTSVDAGTSIDRPGRPFSVPRFRDENLKRASARDAEGRDRRVCVCKP